MVSIPFFITLDTHSSNFFPVHNLCPLCSSAALPFCEHREIVYLKCSGCLSVFVTPHDLPGRDRERNRYLKHINDVNSVGYREFVAPLVDVVLSRFNAGHSGLDYGSGRQSAVSHMLSHSGYSIAMYDPFFHNHPHLLEKQYDYIVCCEVMEHFHHPHQEFQKLRSMLEDGGELICMTELLTDAIDFIDWYYKNDFTHVFFYHPRSLEYIRTCFNFSGLTIGGRVIRFCV